jgi:hypothetical protein
LRTTGIKISGMKKLMHLMFLSCLKATELIEKKLHFHLTVREKLQLKMHKAMCDACSNYEKHSVIIEKAVSQNLSIEQPDVDLSNLKKSILSMIEESK